MSVIEFSCDGYRVTAALGETPAAYASYVHRASLTESFDLEASEGGYCFLSVGPVEADWPTLVVEQRYSPWAAGFHPGVLVVPESHLLLVGAGTRLLAYELQPSPRRLWVDETEVGFWSWSRHGDVVLMSAELELAAWSLRGAKLWSMFVEPPWSFSVSERRVNLDVMGKQSSFPLHVGPKDGG